MAVQSQPKLAAKQTSKHPRSCTLTGDDSLECEAHSPTGIISQEQNNAGS